MGVGSSMAGPLSEAVTAIRQWFNEGLTVILMHRTDELVCLFDLCPCAATGWQGAQGLPLPAVRGAQCCAVLTTAA